MSLLLFAFLYMIMIKHLPVIEYILVLFTCGKILNIDFGGEFFLQFPRTNTRHYESTNANQKLLETVFSIAICRQSDDKGQSKTMFFL